jgi:type II secretory pathway component GspD/PulD (secretin)
MLYVVNVSAQTPPADSKSADAKPSADTYQTLYLTNATQQSEANDIVTGLRNMLPKSKLYLVLSQSAISMRGTQEDFQLAQKILSDLDRPMNIYRLTYTITETDNGKTTSSQHFTLIATPEHGSELKQGSRIPVFVGTTDAKTFTQNGQIQYIGAQVQYVDVGLTISATISGGPDELSLRTKVEQSSLAEQSSPVGAQDPVIKQTVLDEKFVLAPGKPLILGSLDVPGSTRKQQIEVVAEPVR